MSTCGSSKAFGSWRTDSFSEPKASSMLHLKSITSIVSPSALERSAIYVAAARDLHKIDNQSIVFNGIDDSVGTMPYPLAIAPPAMRPPPRLDQGGLRGIPQP